MKNEEKASEIVIKIQNSRSLDYDPRRANHMYDAAMEMAKWKESQPQIIEIFGKRVKAIVGDDSCENCVFQESVCRYISRGNLCQSADKKFNRHFVEVDEDGNEL